MVTGVDGRVPDPKAIADEKSRQATERAGFSASGKINRTDFGLHWNQALETGGVVVSDEVKLSLDVELVKKAEVAETVAV